MSPHDLPATAFSDLSNKSRSIDQFIGQPIEIAIDTEFQDAQTLTIQAAARGFGRLRIKIYRSSLIPAPSRSFRVDDYLTAGPTCRSGNSRLLQKQTALISSSMSPVVLLRDLFRLPLRPVNRHQGLQVLNGLSNSPLPRNAEWSPRLKRMIVPTIDLSLIGHFLPADFARIFGRHFFSKLLDSSANDRAICIADGKVLGFVEPGCGFANRTPIVEFAVTEDGRWFGVALTFNDLMHPFGPASLDSHCRTFLAVSKSEAISATEKAEMLATFRRKRDAAYGYAAADAVNTLMVYEEMQVRHLAIYEAFDCPDELIPLMRSTCGRRTADFLLAMTRMSLGGASRELSSERAVKALMLKGGRRAFANGASHFGEQTGTTHGGLLCSRTPTRFWHAAPGQLRDVDMSACYNRIIAGLPVYWGRPVVLEPGSLRLTLVEAIRLASKHAAADGWFVRVSGDIAAPNALIPSTLGAITSENYLKRGRTKPRALPHDAPKQGSKLFSRRIESGIVTRATWAMIQALPPQIRAEYESLTADSVVFYPAKLVAEDGEQFDRLHSELSRGELPWHATLDLDLMNQVTVETLDYDFVSLRLPLNEYASRIAVFRKQAQETEGKGSGADAAWKLQANTMYGVLASPFLPTQNIVGANQVTATARAQAFALVQSLNGLQVITDGCSYRRDRIPACSFSECLEVMPDYPLRHADENSGVPFVDPETIPTDDAGFSVWYRKHASSFFNGASRDFKALLRAQELVHKLTAGADSPAFDALACDGAGNYLKCMQTADGEWEARDVATRGFGKTSKEQLVPWIVNTYSSDRLRRPPPITEDIALLKLKEAQQKAAKALREGTPEVLLPLGMQHRRIRSYKVIKPSAFIFQTPCQYDAFLKHFAKFCDRTGCGLEVLALRRAYRGRRRGSLSDLAEIIYQLIEAGARDFGKQLNLSRPFRKLTKLSAKRLAALEKRRAAAADELLAMIDVRQLPPEALTTGIVLAGRR